MGVRSVSSKRVKQRVCPCVETGGTVMPDTRITADIGTNMALDSLSVMNHNYSERRSEQ